MSTRREFLAGTAVAGLAATVPLPVFASEDKHKLFAQDLFDLKFLRDGQLSPDGRRVAYAVSLIEGEQERFEIWIGDSRGRARRRLPFTGNASAPRWSPDGDWLAFAGDGRLHVAQTSSLTVAQPLTPQNLSMQGAASWSPDGKRLAVSLMERKTAKGLRRIINSQFRADGVGFLDSLTQQIYEVALAPGALRCLTTGVATICSQPQWSTCGCRILFFASDDAVPFASYSPRLLTVELEDGKFKEVLGSPWFITGARWLPGGERIAVAAARASTLTIPNPSLWVVDRSGANLQLRTPNMIGNVGSRINHDMPARDLMGGNMLVVLDESTAFASVQRGGAVEIWRVSLQGSIAVDKVVTGERSCIILDAHKPGDSVLFAVTDLTKPPELYRASLKNFREEKLTYLNDEVLARWPAIEVKPFVFGSAGGLKIEAWNLRPAGSKSVLPTVLYIHSGPFGATGHAFRYDFLHLASEGFGVVFANFRGSAGYGDAFTRAIMGDWGGLGFPDHMGTVDAAIARGFADADRLGVWGPSHGGFATCWMVGHTNRFKAALAEAAMSDFTSLYYLTDAPDSFRRDLGGTPVEMPEVYRDRSPLTYAHRCTTPTLLIHGEEDLRCPIGQAEQFHRALREAGCTAELLRLPGGSHLADSVGPLSGRLAQNEALVEWFKRHLS